jgi:GxxExxY protein
MRQIEPALEKKTFEGKHAQLSEEIIGIFFRVHAELGFGFSEKVYQAALAMALRDGGLKVDEQVPLNVYYHGQQVGVFFADMIVNDVILLELKSGASILEEHEAQLLNYLKATEVEVGYVLNFGKSATFKRKIFDNEPRAP